MKLIFLFLTLGLYAISSYSQTSCDIATEYNHIFSIKKVKFDDEEYLDKIVNKIDTSSCFSALVNNNKLYIDYLLTHFSDNSTYQALLAINDSTALQNEFITSLKKDSVFTREINKLAKKVTDKLNYIPDTVSMSELLNIAVKYFLIVRINNDGYYVGKVCTGINGLKQTEKERSPQIEAFVSLRFLIIIREVDSTYMTNLLREWRSCMKLI